MSRNLVTVLVVLSLIIGFKGAELLYYRVIDKTAGIDSQEWEERQLLNRKAIQQLSIGDPLAKVSDSMGTADFNVVKPFNEELYQVLYYRTHHLIEDGKTTMSECTPLIFKDQTLIGWGHEFFDFTFPEQSPTGEMIVN